MALRSNCQIRSYGCRGVGNWRWHPPPSILGFESVALTNVPWFMRTWEGGIRFSFNPLPLVYYLDYKYFAEIKFWRISVKKSFFFVKIFTKYNHRFIAKSYDLLSTKVLYIFDGWYTEFNIYYFMSYLF